ncbi:unnamed protein product, partial [Ectocarpus sp. 12 AP-2014]
MSEIHKENERVCQMSRGRTPRDVYEHGFDDDDDDDKDPKWIVDMEKDADELFASVVTTLDITLEEAKHVLHLNIYYATSRKDLSGLEGVVLSENPVERRRLKNVRVMKDFMRIKQTKKGHIRSQLVAAKFLGLYTKLVLLQEVGGAVGGCRLIRAIEKKWDKPCSTAGMIAICAAAAADYVLERKELEEGLRRKARGSTTTVSALIVGLSEMGYSNGHLLCLRGEQNDFSKERAKFPYGCPGESQATGDDTVPFPFPFLDKMRADAVAAAAAPPVPAAIPRLSKVDTPLPLGSWFLPRAPFRPRCVMTPPTTGILGEDLVLHEEAEAGPAGLEAYTRERKVCDGKKFPPTILLQHTEESTKPSLENQARQEVCDRLVSVIDDMRSVLMEVRENRGGGSLTTDLAARANVALSAVTAGTSAFGDMLRLERPFDIPPKPSGVMNPLAKTARESGKRKPRASDGNNGSKRSGSKAGAAAQSGGANASVSKATGSGGTASLDTETSRKCKALKTTAKAAVKGSKLSSRASSAASADNNSDDAVLASRDADGDTGTPSTLVSGGVQQQQQKQVRSGGAEDPIALSSSDEDAESNGARGSAESGAMEENGTAPAPAQPYSSGVLVDHNSAQQQQQGSQGTGTAGVRTGTSENSLGAQAPSNPASATH